MLKVKRSKDCGNSPKNKLVEDLVVSALKGDFKSISGWLSSTTRWSRTIRDSVVGKDSIRLMFDSVRGEHPKSAQIQRVLSHGKLGAVDGSLIYENGSTVRFCVLIEFSSASAKSVKAFDFYEMALA